MNALIGNSKNAAKRIFYRVFTPSLPAEVRLRLGYVFHTEAVFDRAIFERQLEFLKAFHALTGQKAICTIMTPQNVKVSQGMKLHGTSNELFVERVRELGRHASLGYHGHFYFDEASYLLPEAEIRCNNYCDAAVRAQLGRELGWFTSNNLAHSGTYSAGWWFMNAPMQRILMEHGFELDFSFSKSPWFRNQYSYELMKNEGISTGEPFFVSYENRKLFCVQNLIGCHTTPFPEDFLRNVSRLNDSPRTEWLAVTHSHDYDLDLPNTLRCIETLLRSGNVEIVSVDAFRQAAASAASTFKNLKLTETQ